MNRRDEFVERVVRMLTEHEIIQGDLSCESLEIFKQELQGELKMFQLRLPKLTKAQAKLNKK